MKKNKLHPLVLKTKLVLQKLDEQGVVTWGERRSYRGVNLAISVEPKLRERALNFMNSFILLLEENGYSVKLHCNRLHVEMYNEFTEFNLRQKYYRKRIKDDNNYSYNTFIKSNDLEFQIGYSYKKGWIDKKTQKFEDQLISIYNFIEERSKYWAESTKRHRAAKDEREREKLLEQEKARLIAIEKSKFEALVKRSQNYKLANEIREYLSQFELERHKEGKIDEKDQKYIKWGYQKADEIDPLLNYKES